MRFSHANQHGPIPGPTADSMTEALRWLLTLADAAPHLGTADLLEIWEEVEPGSARRVLRLRLVYCPPTKKWELAYAPTITR